jgi:hypothetical protein
MGHPIDPTSLPRLDTPWPADVPYPGSEDRGTEAANPVSILNTLPFTGDLIAAATARLGIDRLANYVAEQLGGECHCPERREKLNRLDARLRKWLGMG